MTPAVAVQHPPEAAAPSPAASQTDRAPAPAPAGKGQETQDTPARSEQVALVGWMR
jgi:hypothetical protein